jgi:hypothetical protein
VGKKPGKLACDRRRKICDQKSNYPERTAMTFQTKLAWIPSACVRALFIVAAVVFLSPSSAQEPIKIGFSVSLNPPSS